MDSDQGIHFKMSEIEWFSRCGTQPLGDLPVHFQRTPNLTAAVTSACGPVWKWVGTEAQNDLTGYLAKHHYVSYAGHWNRLGDAIEDRIQKEIMPQVNDALARLGAESLSHLVLLDLTRIALWAAYRKRFKRVPDFFEKLFAVYESGYLPCGWEGDLEAWPEGKLIVY